MKITFTKLSIIVLGILSVSTTIKAQKLVSTSVQNKVFLLEKATGVACGGCPALDDTCQYTVNQHPGKGILIEYHVGPDARPQTGLPDFMTKHGDSLNNSIPYGFCYNMLINRRDRGIPYGYVYIYNQIQTGATDVIAETSPVNIGMSSTYNSTTREVSIDVEAYYTANGDSSLGLLNIALTEDSIHGKQYDGRISKWVDGYNHMHVFRGNLTGQWGDTISSTTKGSLFTKTYKYTLPATFNAKNCHLICFVANPKRGAKPQKYIGDIETAIIASVGGSATGMESPLAGSQLSVFPNPSNGIFNISSPDCKVEVCDLMGNVILKTNNETTLDLTGQPKGIYVIKIQSMGGSSIQKVVLQ